MGYNYTHIYTCKYLYTYLHLYLFLHLCILKLMSFPWYLQFQPNATGFILAFSSV